MPKTIPVIIEAVQYTPGMPHMLVLYAGRGVTSGPLAQTQNFSPTQQQLFEHNVGRPALEGEEYVWGDADVVALLAAHLDENGIAATVELQKFEPPSAPATPLPRIPAPPAE